MVSHEEEVFVSIIIPNHNGKRFAESCLRSILNMNYKNLEIIIVDDVSTDGSVEFIEELFGFDPRLTIIRLDKNSGAAAARNAGIRASKGKYLAFLDIDTEVDPNWLKELVKGLESDPKIGVAQGKILHMNNHKLIQYVGMLIIPYLGLIVNIGGDKEDDGSYDSVKEICATTHMIIKREVVNRVGFFDPKLFTCYEEVDFSWRVWLGGYKQIFVPRAINYHSIGHLTARKRKSIEFYLSRNPIRMIIKNYSMKNLILYLPLSMLGMSLRNFVRLVKWNDSYPILAFLQGIIWNLANFHDTLKERYKVQRLIRKVPDDYIMKHIMVTLSPLSIWKKYLAHEEVSV